MLSPDQRVLERLSRIIRLSEQSPAASAEWAEYWGEKNGRNDTDSIIEKLSDSVTPGRSSYIIPFIIPADFRDDKSPLINSYEQAYRTEVQNAFNHLMPEKFSVVLVGRGQLQIQW